jgi:hypothetical protein
MPPLPFLLCHALLAGGFQQLTMAHKQLARRGQQLESAVIQLAGGHIATCKVFSTFFNRAHSL